MLKEDKTSQKTGMQLSVFDKMIGSDEARDAPSRLIQYICEGYAAQWAQRWKYCKKFIQNTPFDIFLLKLKLNIQENTLYVYNITCRAKIVSF